MTDCTLYCIVCLCPVFSQMWLFQTIHLEQQVTEPSRTSAPSAPGAPALSSANRQTSLLHWTARERLGYENDWEWQVWRRKWQRVSHYIQRLDLILQPAVAINHEVREGARNPNNKIADGKWRRFYLRLGHPPSEAKHGITYLSDFVRTICVLFDQASLVSMTYMGMWRCVSKLARQITTLTRM